MAHEVGMDRAPRTDLRSLGWCPAPRPDDAFLRDVLAGLDRPPRSLPSRYFYDAHGSRLFQWITRLPGYYLTRVEREILDRHGEAMVAPLRGGPCTVVDLAQAALDEAAARVRAELPGTRVVPVRAAYASALRRLGRLPGAGPKLVLFLGSSIGNLEHAAAVALLRELRSALGPGDHLLVGFDLVKPLPLLRRAYHDPQGVTRAFNLNLLARLNRELGADFDLPAFRHLATWDPERPAMESWLESTRAQAVHLPGRAIHLAAGERIHTEISCKYRGAQVTALGADAGLGEVARWSDPDRWFLDVLWRVAR